MSEIETKQFTLRLTPWLYNELAERAKRNHRSMNSEITFILEEGVAEDQRVDGQLLVENRKSNQ